MLLGTGCATIVDGNERALYFSARQGLAREPVGGGWYWHLPWNSYVIYDLRWHSHKESIHIHSRDGLHMELDVVAVVRPNPREIYQLHTDVGPNFYEGVIKPAVYGAVRDASGHFDHLAIATQTHSVEQAIQAALVEHLRGQHVEVAEVAIQHFDLPGEVEQAANRKAASGQLLAAKEVELGLAQRDAEIDQARRRGAIEAQGLERKLRAQQELDQTTQQIQIEEMRRKADLEKARAEADSLRVRADAEAQAIRVRADAEKMRWQSPGYVRLQALEILAKALTAGNQRLVVMPIGKNGLPAFFAPFLNPLESLVTSAGKSSD
jgi:regulator of protease activity HflC (stomatin/prohibitin superfamily)